MINSLLVALGQLSALPLGARFRKAPEGRESEVMVLYPLAGLLLGIIPVAALIVSARLLGFQAPLPAVIAVLAMALINSLSGLADLARTADALGSGLEPPEALAIAESKTVGACGAIAVALDLLVKGGALVALSFGGAAPQLLGHSRAADAGAASDLGSGLAAPHPLGLPAGMLLAVLLASALGRWVAVIAAAHSDYARPEGGEDEWQVRYCSAREMRWSAVVVAALVAGVGAASYALAALPWYRCIFAAVGCYLFGCLASMAFERRLGGVTGRQLRAVSEAGETLALALMCALNYG